MSSNVTLEENPPSVQVETRKGDLLIHPSHMNVKDIIYILEYSLGENVPSQKTCIKFGKHIMNHILHKTT